MGLLGVCSFVGSMLWNIKNAARAARHSGPSVGRTVAVAAASAMCGAMVCGLADFLWNYPGCCAFSGSPSPWRWQASRSADWKRHNAALAG